MSAFVRTDRDISAAYEKHVDMVYRVCFMFMKRHTQDMEDAVQKTFIKYIEHPRKFDSDEHEKAWLIVTASNICRDMLKHWWNKRENLDKVQVESKENGFERIESLDCLVALPDKYKAPLYLFYVEGYNCKEIAVMLHKSQNVIWNYLHTGRILLKQKLEASEK